MIHYRVISKEEFLGEPALKSPSRRGSYVEKEAKADLAFKVFDRNHDGYITKEEMLKGSKNLTKKQVKRILQIHLKSHKNLNNFSIYNLYLCWFLLKVQAVFELNDADHDGKLTREEFHEFMSHPNADNSKK